jgi:16S rRNA (guanine527-N7)-methyltransferase
VSAKLGPLVDRAAEALGLSLGSQVRDALLSWLGLLLDWNSRTDLTAARDEAELVDIMLADALVIAAHVPQGARIIDVGAGAGAPGLALALVRADLAVTLVEPLAKRASFLRSAMGVVGRSDISVARVRGEALAGRRAWDVALSRATLKPGAWLELAAGLVAPGGTVWVFLAKETPPALHGAALEHDLHYRWPLTGAARRTLSYTVE